MWLLKITCFLHVALMSQWGSVEAETVLSSYQARKPSEEVGLGLRPRLQKKVRSAEHGSLSPQRRGINSVPSWGIKKEDRSRQSPASVSS
jgi:hypothetical protein